jgi:Putative zinc-finger
LNPELSDIDPHRHAAEQIPWYVNGSLDASEASRLKAHLDECAPCRSDYEAQLRLFAAMQADSTLVFAAEPSFQKLMARITDGADAAALLGPPASAAPVVTAIAPRKQRTSTRSAARWLAAAVVLEGLFLGYGAWVWHARNSTAASYVTLASADPSYRDSPRVRIVFRPGLSLQGLGGLLHAEGAHIIDGPTASNVYTLGFTGADVTPRVVALRAAALRANADVLFAEPQGVHGEGEGNDSR